MNNVEYFFRKDFEKQINIKMLRYDYEFPCEKILDYVNMINSINISEILNYISSDIFISESIESSDIFQFSNLDDAIIKICEIFKAANDPGLRYFEIGNLLLNDGLERKKGAFIKYGENHAKTAELLSLLHNINNTYFLSCIGYIFCDLDKEQQTKLLTRLVLRNKLIIRLLRASKNGKVNVREFLYMISDSTYIRRRSNIKSILNLLTRSDEYDFSNFINNLRF